MAAAQEEAERVAIVEVDSVVAAPAADLAAAIVLGPYSDLAQEAADSAVADSAVAAMVAQEHPSSMHHPQKLRVGRVARVDRQVPELTVAPVVKVANQARVARAAQLEKEHLGQRVVPTSPVEAHPIMDDQVALELTE